MKIFLTLRSFRRSLDLFVEKRRGLSHGGADRIRLNHVAKVERVVRERGKTERAA